MTLKQAVYSLKPIMAKYLCKRNNNTMKKIITLAAMAGAFLASDAVAQTIVSDSAVMGAGYTNQIFYDLTTGNKNSAPVLNWDIAHTTVGRDNAIRANHMTGLQVIPYPKGDNGDWATFDTTGWKSWRKVYNDIHSHNLGAFNQQVDPDNVWDFSWGVYNSTSHEVVGDSLYLLAWQSAPNTYVKFVKFMPIKQDPAGNLIFKYADLNGSNEKQDTLFQSDFTGRNYKYYSFTTGNKPNREPDNKTWDITFTRYYEPTLNPMTSTYEMYPVMGVESNRGTRGAKLIGSTWTELLTDSVNLVKNSWSSMSDDMTVIGSDWKRFDNNQFRWFMNDTQSYLIERYNKTAKDSSYYLIHFTKFGGTGSGKIWFDYIKLGNTMSVRSAVLGTMKLFPNPASNKAYITYDSKINGTVVLNVSDINGKTVYTQSFNAGNGLNAIEIPVSQMQKGMYFVQLSTDKGSMTSKLQVQ